MRLTKVVISGFKSFKDKTIIEIPANVVAVVGPNGCGKSNIVDAIKWALGEQNPKYLRAKHMEDIIFAGTSEFAPVGFAEVSLFFQRTDTPFPEPYSSLNELVITRRLYRSGESEYLINKSPCRLKDIQDITIDTGLGQRFYGLIEQGMIESFMNYKPEEKRLIFEEVAGTAKYRVRKKATLQKLESAKLNLERVEDIISEVKDRCDVLEKEAKRAMEYKKIYDELKIIELFVSSENYKRQRDLLESKKQEYEILERDINDKELKLQNLETELELNKNNLFFLEQEYSSLSKIFANIVEQKNNIEKEYSALKEGKAYRVQKINVLDNELLSIKQKIESTNQEREELERRLVEKERFIKEQENIIKEKEAKENTLRIEIKNLESEIITLQKELINDKNQSAFLASQIAYEEKSYEESLRKLEILKQEGNSLEDEIECLKKEIGEFKNQGDSIKSEKINIENKIREKTEKIVLDKKEASELRKKMNEKSLKKERILGSYNSIKKMLEEYKGLSSGTQHVLKNFGKDEILGTIIEKVDVNENFMTAFENFLKDKIETILVKNMDTAVKIIDYLKLNKLGACNILPVEFTNASSDNVFEKMNGRINAKEEVLPALSTLFDRVELVENIDIAINRFKEGERKTYITFSGEILDEKGVVFGGSREKHNPYMVEKVKLRELETELDNLEKEINSFQELIGQREAEIRSLENNINELKIELENLNLELSEHNIELRHKEEELKRKTSKKFTLQQEIKNLEFNCNTYEKKKIELVQKYESLLSLIEHKEKKVNEKSLQLEDKRNLLEQVSKELTGFKIVLAEEKRNYQHLNENYNSLKNNLNSLNRQKENIENEYKTLKELDYEAERKIEKWEKELEVIVQQENEIIEKKRGTESELEKLRIKIREEEQIVSKLRTEIEKAKKSLMNVKDKLMELTLKLENSVDRIKEKYFVDLSMSFEEYLLLNVEREKCNNDYMDSLRKRLLDFGEVNLLSIDEYEEVKKRYEFLCKQKADLETSIESLNKAIERINTVSLELFSEALKNIGNNFDRLFKRLFGGGKAKIVLTEEENPLESGVDIVVELPYKRFQSINLLSGGEKALVTLSLIFAFYMQKPSPFCILDEVDAPLDDSNVLKFRDLLNEMSKISQFLIVTHNKIVMETASALLGVTMETPGVSKLVAVKTYKEIV